MPLERANICLAAVILGAGRSVRMGRPKLLLPWGKTSVLGHLLRQWSSAGVAQIGLVHAARDSGMLKELNRLGVSTKDRIENPNPDRGMFSSIVCAARSPFWSSLLTHWAIALGDQPHLKLESLRQLLEFAKYHPDNVSQPMRNGKRRHPVVIPKSIFLKLASSSSNSLKEFLSTHEVSGFECDDPGLDLDMDTPEDYRQAKALGQVEGSP